MFSVKIYLIYVSIVTIKFKLVLMRTYNNYYSDKGDFLKFANEHSIRDEKNVLVQIFSSILDKSILQTIVKDILDVIPSAKIIGATTDGEILDSKVTTDKIVLSTSVFEKATLKVEMVENKNNDSFECGESLAKKLICEDTKALIIFSDGLGINGEFFLDGVSSVSKDIPIAGGMAGDAVKFENTYVFCNDSITTSGAVGVSVNAKKLHVNTTYSFYWQEIGKPLTITKAKDNRVYEIDGMSAVDIYGRYLGKDVSTSLPATGIEFPLIITRDGVKIARAVIGKEEDGSLIFAGNLAVGDVVYFGYGNSNMILEESIHAREKFSNVAVESIFVYSCMARRRFLGEAISAELAPLSSIAPTSGFFTYGEFYKANKGELLNQTMTVIALSEGDDTQRSEYDYESIGHAIIESSATHKALSHLIQETSQELKDTNDNLERLVEIKTQELQNKVEELERASEVKSDFLANMSHEIRTPLNAILGFVDILKSTETNKERLKRFSIVKSSGDSLLTVINDILDFSKIESGKMLLEKRKFATKKPFKEVGLLFYERAKENGINLKIHFDETLPRFFVGDIVRIKQVAANFLSNAIKFTNKNGEILMNISFDTKANELKFSVKDNGVGIDEKNLSKIFESFSQEDTSTTRRFGGTGLGLSISTALIDSMEGKITVDSVLGEGSEFSFYLPVIQASTQSVDSNDDVKKIDVNKQLNGRILLVEDNETNQMLMNILLGDLGLVVDLAENGLIAVEKFKNSINVDEYDLVLMDENMPKMNGVEATGIILDFEKENNLDHTPIVALTANALATDRERFLKAGMDEFVSKPIDHEMFIRVLHSFLLDE